ncbi:MAG: zinc ribbon domain-containing protein [Clostridia bacterium]|nr:zinc ribbon domain-containing protein [Clostridia bacterium]
MPFLQYKCVHCGKRFEELVQSHKDEVKCPECGGTTARDYSGTMYSSTGTQSKKCSGNCKTCSGCR